MLTGHTSARASVAMLLCLLAGCGGGGGGGNGGGGGRTVPLSVTIAWAPRSRAILAPVSALSAGITLAGANSTATGDFTWTINRDANSAAFTQTYNSTDQALTGTWPLTIRFYSQPDLAGSVVGTAQTTVTIDKNNGGIGDVAVTATVAAVTIPAGQTVAVGHSTDLAVTATDTSGSLVALAPGAAFFVITGGATSLQVTPGGTATGLAAGSATVTATVDGKTSAPATVQVTGITTNGRGSVVSDTVVGQLSQAAVQAEMQSLGIAGTAAYGTVLHKLDYRTVDLNGNLVVASGMLVLPQGATGALPIVSLQHPTASGKTDVPSNPNNQAAQAGWDSFAPFGYVVVAADYLGLGDSTTGFHPFVHAASEATACVDMLRAARSELPGLSVTSNGKLFLSGYSEGGHATMALHRALEGQYASEFTVTASAPISGPYDLSGTERPFLLAVPDLSTQGRQIAATLLAYAIVSYQNIGTATGSAAYHIYNQPSDVFAAPYDTQAPPLFDGNHSVDQITSTLAITPAQLLTSSYFNDLKNNASNTLTLALAQNNVFDWKPVAPIKLLHSSGDTLISYQNAVVAQARMAQLGGNVTLVDLGSGLDHGDAGIPGLATARAFFDSQSSRAVACKRPH